MIGIGPVLARLERAGVPIEVRAVPVVGWVEVELPRRGRYLHRRRGWFAAAGPLASLSLSFLLVLSAYAMGRGMDSVGPSEAAGAASLTIEMAVSTPVHLARSIGDLAWPGGSGPNTTARADSEDGPGSSGSAATVSDDDAANAAARPVSVIGATSLMSNDIDDYGRIAVPLWAAGFSAAIAGFNMVPAFGLDGHQILTAAVDGVRARNRRAGRALRAASALLGLVIGAWAAVAILHLLASDLVALI